MTEFFRGLTDFAYATVRAKFDAWGADKAFHDYVVPVSTRPRAGFAIFYTPPTYRPPLLILGQNPANFAASASLAAAPNAEWLAGEVPERNSYLEDDHRFATTLRRLFAGHSDLLSAAVGMNAWYFQQAFAATEAPSELREFCEGITRGLIAAIEPRAILCFGRPAFNVANRRAVGRRIAGARFAEVVPGETPVWYCQHPTGSRTAVAAAADAPIVLAEIAKYLAE